MKLLTLFTKMNNKHNWERTSLTLSASIYANLWILHWAINKLSWFTGLPHLIAIFSPGLNPGYHLCSGYHSRTKSFVSQTHSACPAQTYHWRAYGDDHLQTRPSYLHAQCLYAHLEGMVGCRRRVSCLFAREKCLSQTCYARCHRSQSCSSSA